MTHSCFDNVFATFDAWRSGGDARPTGNKKAEPTIRLRITMKSVV
jgi:hypothetical protein